MLYSEISPFRGALDKTTISSTLRGFPLHQAVIDQNTHKVEKLLRCAILKDFSTIIVYYNLENLAFRVCKNAVDPIAKSVALKIHELVVHFKLFYAISESNLKQVEKSLKLYGNTLDLNTKFSFNQGPNSSLLEVAKNLYLKASKKLENNDPKDLLKLQTLALNRLKIWNLLIRSNEVIYNIF